MSDKASKIPSNNAMPCRPFAGIELLSVSNYKVSFRYAHQAYRIAHLLLYVLRNVLRYPVSLNCRRGSPVSHHLPSRYETYPWPPSLRPISTRLTCIATAYLLSIPTSIASCCISSFFREAVSKRSAIGFHKTLPTMSADLIWAVFQAISAWFE